MNTFLVVAAFMAAIAATAVALPLIRNRRSRLLGAVAGAMVIGASAVLYPLWSNWNWHATAQAQVSPDVLAMVAKLERHLHDQPNDLAGWLMLGRSYLALERGDDAVAAYEHARGLDAGNVDALLGLGEAMSLRDGGDLTPAEAELFEKAVTLAPNNPKALLYGGFAAAARGDQAAARNRWQALKNMHPPAQIDAMLDERIAELGSAGAEPASGASPTGVPGRPEAQATINLSIAPALKSRLTDTAQLFVFAREPGGQGPPLAAKRLASSAIGTQIHLSSADSMVAGRTMAPGQRVSIVARVSFSGQPLPAAGDLYGELTYEVGRDGARDLVIDRIAK
ncbi:MAG: tetratricopeptide repeat protein [Steroidobacteraceae bacterium]